MREIISIHVGQAGNRIGQKFWQVISSEHGITETGAFQGQSNMQIERIGVYYNESSSGRYVPRAILTDLEGATIHSVLNGPYGCIFDADKIAFGNSGASNNFAKGYYSDGVPVIENVIELVRKEAEQCDFLQGFQVLHASGGGAGSGLGSLLLNILSSEYDDRILAAFTVFPSPKVSDVVVEPYNTIMALKHIAENCCETFVLDNEALFEICFRKLHLKTPALADLNHLISLVMSGCTAGFRFPGQLNMDLRKLAVNMIPFPSMIFLIPAFAPLISQYDQKYKNISVPHLIQEIFSVDSLMLSGIHQQPIGKYITCSAMFRGKMSTFEVMEQLFNIQERNPNRFINWMPQPNCTTSLCDIAQQCFKINLTLLTNTTSIVKLFERVRSQYSTLFKRKAFTHWYVGEGMHEDDFVEAEHKINDIINLYSAMETSDRQ